MSGLKGESGVDEVAERKFNYCGKITDSNLIYGLNEIVSLVIRGLRTSHKVIRKDLKENWRSEPASAILIRG